MLCALPPTVSMRPATSLQAFLHAQDEGGSLQLRVATAALLAPHLRTLKLVSSQGGGRATSAFLQQGGRLRQLSIDFWGSGNALPRQLACCTSLQRLQLQCSSRLGGYSSLGALTGLRELAVVDSDWAAIPAEVAGEGLNQVTNRVANRVASQFMVINRGLK